MTFASLAGGSLHAQALFVTSCLRNYLPAIQTLAHFAEHFNAAGIQLALGLEVEAERSGRLDDRASVRDVLREISRQPWREVWIWTRECDALVANRWPVDLPRPLYPEFSYGGAWARQHYLAALANCRFLVRTDPGCEPPADVSRILSEHLSQVASGAVEIISGQYEGRLALRDHFVIPERRPEYYELVRTFTGLEPLAQLTGGALYTCAIDSPPPLQFNGAKVWGGDDGIMQLLCPGRIAVRAGNRIFRSEPGFAMSLDEYLVRLSSSATLYGLHQGLPLEETELKALKFLERLLPLVCQERAKTLDIATIERVLKQKAPIIRDGFERYPSLQARWPAVLATMRLIPGLQSACRVR